MPGSSKTSSFLQAMKATNRSSNNVMFFVFIYKKLSVCPHPLLLPLPLGEGEGIRKSDEVCYSIIFLNWRISSFVTRHLLLPTRVLFYNSVGFIDFTMRDRVAIHLLGKSALFYFFYLIAKMIAVFGSLHSRKWLIEYGSSVFPTAQIPIAVFFKGEFYTAFVFYFLSELFFWCCSNRGVR